MNNPGEGAIKEKITLTAEEVSQIMGMSKRFVYELAQRGELPCRRFGKKVLFSRVAIEQLMEEPAGSSS
jgi:excisionase family DNA binding protein